MENIQHILEQTGTKTAKIKMLLQLGMTRKQVVITYGPPSRIRTPNPLSDTWIYWADRVKSKRVVFKDDKVLTELILD